MHNLKCFPYLAYSKIIIIKILIIIYDYQDSLANE